MSENPEELNRVFSELASSATMSALDAQSNEMHEVFLSLVGAGFTQRQALYIVSLAIISADYGDDEDDEDDSYEMGITITIEDQPEEASEDLQLITEEDSSAPGDAEGEEDEAP
jgi:hypothetical protein